MQAATYHSKEHLRSLNTSACLDYKVDHPEDKLQGTIIKIPAILQRY